MSIQDAGVIIAITLSILSFGKTLWDYFLNRPRIIFFVEKVKITIKVKKKPEEWIQITACNLGFRGIILKEFIIIGNDTIESCGIYDPVKAPYGVRDQKLPQLVTSGQSIRFNIVTFERVKNILDKAGQNTFYIFFIDSFNKHHFLESEDFLFEIGLINNKKKVFFLKKYLRGLEKNGFFARIVSD